MTPVFAGMSTEAARMIDPTYTVLPIETGIYGCFTFLITFVGTLVTEKILNLDLENIYSEEV